jgi:hypothetical protein
MLNVCSEFERIAKIVLDKTEKEVHSRRKRKQQDSKEDGAATQGDAKTPRARVGTPAARNDPKTPQPSQPGNIPNVFTPPDMSKYLTEEVSSSDFKCGETSLTKYSQALQSLNGSLQNGMGPGTPGSQFLSPHVANANLPGANGHSRATSTASLNMDFTGASNASTPAMMNDMPVGNSFAQPFVPQDLWQMPMTLEWDWAGMTDYSGGFEDAAVPGGLETSGVISNLPASGPWHQNNDGAATTK